MPTDAYRTFAPRLARVVAGVIGIVTLVAAGVFIALVPGFRLPDKAGTAALAILIAAFCYRQATVRAVPDRQGLSVRNLVFSRRLEWPEIIGVTFGDGTPWATLDLADGETLAVMGIQRSDGDFARTEARRLATLIQVHGEAR